MEGLNHISQFVEDLTFNGNGEPTNMVDLNLMSQFVEDLTGRKPQLLCDVVIGDIPYCFEVSQWSNPFRKLYRAFENETQDMWIYAISAYGKRVRIYISKREMTVEEMMESEEFSKTEEEVTYDFIPVSEDDYNLFEKSTIFV